MLLPFHYRDAADPEFQPAVIARHESRRHDTPARTTWAGEGRHGRFVFIECAVEISDPWIVSWQPPGATKPVDILFARSMLTCAGAVRDGRAVGTGAYLFAAGLASMLRCAP